jgi:hypothetical protein
MICVKRKVVSSNSRKKGVRQVASASSGWGQKKEKKMLNG